MLADLGPLALETQHEVQPRVHRRELLDPDVLEDAEHGELARLIDERVVRDDGEVEVHARPQTSDIGRRGVSDVLCLRSDVYFLENGIHARVRSHSSASTPPCPSLRGSIAMVNCSSGCASRSTFMSSRAKSCFASYWVPHCPVLLLTMSFHPSGEGTVHRLYLPAGRLVPAITRSALVSSTVASFAPVRHTLFQGTTLPKIARPCIEGRL